jgi:hypothetical protein
MRLPSQIIADRYQLRLQPSWQHWFDVVAKEYSLPGCFRHAADVDGLCAARPNQIWPGFMLPDTLPLLNNGYGDWICVRIDEQDQPAELIHWYHGGGDWIPVGRSLAEAIIHDLVDLSRPVRKQMLRGAVESPRPNTITRDLSAPLMSWLSQSLAEIATTQSFNLDRLLKLLSAGNYAESLELLIESGVAIDAATCDLIESIIQLAVPSEHGSLHMMPVQDCNRIESMCSSLVQRRSDLGWGFSLLGWCQKSNQRKELACETFFNGRFASAFSDQSVRLRLHKFEQRFGKYSIAQLIRCESCLPTSMQEDDYLRIFLSSRDGDLHGLVQQYWLSLARKAMHAGDFASGYNFAFNAGWDIGAASMAGYRQILETLHQAALQAGWQARAAVAKAHLDCI